MNHMLVILPGITGSALSRNGLEIWGPAPTAVAAYLRSLGRSLDWLPLKHEDDPEYDDGIRATRLVPYTLVPGLYRFDGYSGLKRHLHERFKLIDGDPHDGQGAPANYFEFPYDWRKDNAISAVGLKQLIDRELPKWRAYNDSPDAQVIFVAHSMGGLVARYFIEVLKGYPCTRALVTFGTPHRGAPQAIDYLVRGYRKAGIELRRLTAVLQSLPSTYQLLPRYAALRDVDGQWKRVFETTHDLAKIDRVRAKQAYSFYERIELAHAGNRDDPEYRVEMLPLVGWGHDTTQSARVDPDGHVEIGVDLPATVDSVFANGDGTVPRVSAVPPEFNDKPARWWMINQKHATMQNNADMLANLTQIVSAMQGDLRQPARALGDSAERGIGLQLDDVFESGEPVVIRVTTHGIQEARGITARVQSTDAESPCRELSLAPAPTGNLWTTEVVGLPAGSYRVSIHPEAAGAPRDPVIDVFEVM